MPEHNQRCATDPCSTSSELPSFPLHGSDLVGQPLQATPCIAGNNRTRRTQLRITTRLRPDYGGALVMRSWLSEPIQYSSSGIAVQSLDGSNSFYRIRSERL